MYNYKKAAMFGLDARIALAIFGALSVISGAALYSAIKQAKITAIITELQEINKAVEEYMLTTGQDLPESSVSGRFQIEALVTKPSSIQTWNGPYLPYTAIDDNALSHPPYHGVHVFNRYVFEPWGGTVGTDASLPECTDASKPCAHWASFSGLNIQQAEEFDKEIDGTLDYKNGKARVYVNAGTAFIYLQGPIKISN
tara:strand:+ start:2424 stop:3017 length:594 start_codon:yes stop_codon:yes gene_type:complete